MFNVYNRYTDTAGNLHFTDCYEKHGREHFIRVDGGEGMSDLIKRDDVQREIQASFDGGAFRWQDGQDLMDRINAIPTAPRWHRLEEELPKDRETVLIYCENTGGIVKSHYHEFIGSGGKKHYWFSGGTYHPKYWMPLPEPPKEDA